MTVSPSLRVSLILVALGLLGCAPTQPTRFYTLSGMAVPPRAASALAPGELVGVGPVTLPGYLDRPQIVTRTAANEAELANLASWLEPLSTLVPRTLADNLSLLLGTDDVVQLPQRRTLRFTYQVEVDVNRFDFDAGGRAVLDARWYVYGRDGQALVQSGRSTITEPAASRDYGAIAAAMSRALGAMSEQIAAAILADQQQR